jgi:hypothetical protein
VEQGEGPQGHWRDAHFGQFVAILDEHEQMREDNPGFEPARPVMAANVRLHDRADAVPVIADPLTARVTDLFNVNYEIRSKAPTGSGSGTPTAPRLSTTRCAAAGTRRTSHSARACTGTWDSPIPPPARARPCSSGRAGWARSPGPPGSCTKSTSWRPAARPGVREHGRGSAAGPGHPGRRRGRVARCPRVPLRGRLLPGMALPGRHPARRRRTRPDTDLGLGPGRAARPGRTRRWPGHRRAAGPARAGRAGQLRRAHQAAVP